MFIDFRSNSVWIYVSPSSLTKFPLTNSLLPNLVWKCRWEKTNLSFFRCSNVEWNRLVRFRGPINFPSWSPNSISRPECRGYIPVKLIDRPLWELLADSSATYGWLGISNRLGPVALLADHSFNRQRTFIEVLFHSW